MPTTRKQQRRFANPVDDRVSKGMIMYPVFCTAKIPPKILDNFIEQAYEGGFLILHRRASVGGAPCILQTTDLDSVTHGSRRPMPDFESPFLNMTDNEIRDWMLKHKHYNFAASTFTILDENTVEKQVCRIGYINEVNPDDRMLWAEFFADLAVRVPLEMGTISWQGEYYVGTNHVLTQKFLEWKLDRGWEIE